MKILLILIVVALVIMVVVSLVRGIAAFLQSTREDLNYTGEGPSPNQLRQNKMMFARIKYQMAAVAALAVLLLVAGGHKS
jgi:hypothetical protein